MKNEIEFKFGDYAIIEDRNATAYLADVCS